MPVEQVVSLLDRWRTADGMFARGRVLTEAVRLLRELTPDERRTLARALAERGSPELAAQFEGSFGGSLEADQVRDIANQLLYMDDDDLAALVDDLRDPDARRELAVDAVDRAFAVDGGVALADGPTVPPPGGTDTPGGPPPPPGTHEQQVTHEQQGSATASDELEAAAAAARDTRDAQRARLQELADADDDLDLDDLTLADGELGDLELGSTELGAVALGGVALGSADLVEPDLVGVDLAGTATGTDDRTDGDRTDGDGGPAAPDHPDDPGPGEPPEPTDDQATGGPADPTGAPVPGGPRHAVSAGGEPDAADPATATSDALLGRLGATTQALPRLKLLDDTRLDELDGSGALAVLDAFPDGWQRRRAALRLIEAGLLTDVTADDLVPRFARTGDATFVVGGLIDAGHLDAASLEGLLPATTVTRLRHRQEG